MAEMIDSTNESSNGVFSRGIILTIGILLVVAIAVASYAQSRSNQSESTMAESEQMDLVQPVDQEEPAEMAGIDDRFPSDDMTASENIDESAETSEVKVVQVEAGSFYFTPNEIRVKKGETVRIEMTSVDMMHNFVIDELEVEIPITTSGNMATVEFTAEEVGEFEYYCDVADHRAKGQVGMLIVEE